MTYHNRSSYVGSWVKGKQHGRGRFLFSNGDYYEGEWWLGKMHGRGVFT